MPRAGGASSKRKQLDDAAQTVTHFRRLLDRPLSRAMTTERNCLNLSLVSRLLAREALPDAPRELVTHRPVGVHALLARAFGRRRIRGRPVLHVGRNRARQLQRAV